MEALINSIAAAYETFRADATLQQEKTTKQQVLAPVKHLSNSKNL